MVSRSNEGLAIGRCSAPRVSVAPSQAHFEPWWDKVRCWSEGMCLASVSGELPGMCPRENVNRRTSLQMVLSVGYDICIYRGDEEDMYVKIFF